MTARLEQICPVLVWPDVGGALDHYRRLGFEVHAYEGDAAYGFVVRDDVQLHVSTIDGHDPTTTDISAYLYVDDADALLAEWRTAGVAGHLSDVTATDYGLREFAHVDPAGNLLRVGSRSPG